MICRRCGTPLTAVEEYSMQGDYLFKMKEFYCYVCGNREYPKVEEKPKEVVDPDIYKVARGRPKLATSRRGRREAKQEVQ